MDIRQINEAIFYLTNQERIKQRIRPLLLDLSLERAATLHSTNMVKGNFFNHLELSNKGLRTPHDRIIHCGGNFLMSGENIAKGPCMGFVDEIKVKIPFVGSFIQGSIPKKITPMEFAQKTVEGWMDSKGHKANILCGSFKFLGVGTAICTAHKEVDYGLCTQNFGG